MQYSIMFTTNSTYLPTLSSVTVNLPIFMNKFCVCECACVKL